MSSQDKPAFGTELDRRLVAHAGLVSSTSTITISPVAPCDAYDFSGHCNASATSYDRVIHSWDWRGRVLSE